MEFQCAIYDTAIDQNIGRNLKKNTHISLAPMADEMAPGVGVMLDNMPVGVGMCNQ